MHRHRKRRCTHVVFSWRLAGQSSEAVFRILQQFHKRIGQFGGWAALSLRCKNLQCTKHCRAFAPCEFTNQRTSFVLFFCYIAVSVTSEDPLVRLLAILDKRVGKRKLQKLIPTISSQPEWLREFYYIRMESENISHG